MKSILCTALALVGCRSSDQRAPSADPAPASPPPARPAHRAPSGPIAGTPFAPTVVMLVETSDGAKLGLYAATPRELRDRQRCEEPTGSASTAELTKYGEWKVGAPLASELSSWGTSGLEAKGTATVTLSKQDPATFALAGTIELAGDGWKLSGPFEGEYCPTKLLKRADAPPPWSMTPYTAAAPPSSPVEAIVAGRPAKIVHATVREVPWHDGTRRQRLVFYASMPPAPCADRPDGGHARMYAGDQLAGSTSAAFRGDSFAIDLAAPPVAGAALAGSSTQSGDVRQQILDADLQVFEPDGFRSWRYAQYYNAALAIDEVGDAEVGGRVQLALPDAGKSLLAGAFRAKRCPPQAR